MINFSRCFGIVAIAAALTASASANTLNLTGGLFYEDAAATVPLTTGKVIAVVADVDGSGFGDYATSMPTDSFTLAGDVLLDIQGIDGFGGTFPGASTNAFVWDNSSKGVSVGTSFAFFWFDLPYTPGIENDGPGANVPFGFFQGSGFGGSFGDFTVPANATSDELFVLNTSASGQLPDSDLAAKYTTAVPEPVSALALSVFGALMIARRRK